LDSTKAGSFSALVSHEEVQVWAEGAEEGAEKGKQVRKQASHSWDNWEEAARNAKIVAVSLT